MEDNRTDVYVIRRVLQECGLNGHVHVASDGQEAILYLDYLAEGSSSWPALVLLDLNVPKISGIGVLQRLREAASPIPVIIVTSSVSDEDRVAAHRLGAEAYFQKPNDLAAYMELGHVIKGVLAR